MPVHLTGRVCDMRAVIKIARKYKLKVIEDAANFLVQSLMEKWLELLEYRMYFTSSIKNFNGIGDGGFVLTNSLSYYKRICSLRNHGIKDRNFVDEFGYVSRYDTLKTNILLTRLKNIKNIISKRRNNAKLYFKYIDKTNVYIPPETTDEFNTYHTFVIQVKRREQLIKFLRKKKIYQLPFIIQYQYIYKKHLKEYIIQKIHLPKTIKQSKEILSLPINEHLTKKEIKFISESINKFYKL